MMTVVHMPPEGRGAMNLRPAEARPAQAHADTDASAALLAGLETWRAVAFGLPLRPTPEMMRFASRRLEA
jgi:hypothetical protein